MVVVFCCAEWTWRSAGSLSHRSSALFSLIEWGVNKGAKTEPRSWQRVRLLLEWKRSAHPRAFCISISFAYVSLGWPITHGRLYTRSLLASSCWGDANGRARCVCSRPHRHVAWGAVTRAAQSQLRITEKHDCAPCPGLTSETKESAPFPYILKNR